jgi:hypothetical protein
MAWFDLPLRHRARSTAAGLALVSFVAVGDSALAQEGVPPRTASERGVSVDMAGFDPAPYQTSETCQAALNAVLNGLSEQLGDIPFPPPGEPGYHELANSIGAQMTAVNAQRPVCLALGDQAPGSPPAPQVPRSSAPSDSSEGTANLALVGVGALVDLGVLAAVLRWRSFTSRLGLSPLVRGGLTVRVDRLTKKEQRQRELDAANEAVEKYQAEKKERRERTGRSDGPGLEMPELRTECTGPMVGGAVLGGVGGVGLAMWLGGALFLSSNPVGWTVGIILGTAAVGGVVGGTVGCPQR